jgi:mannose-6-phosphate isomerase-like protein (cupin superfamily)
VPARSLFALAVVPALVLAGCRSPRHPAPEYGTVSGLAHDHDTGDVLGQVQIRLRAQGEMIPRLVSTDKNGIFTIEHVRPGTYSISALFAGQPIDIENIGVDAGVATFVDVLFTVGRPDPIRETFGNAKEGEIDRYRPASLGASASRIEGSVNDSATHERVVGAVVTAIGPAPSGTVQQTVTDDLGRFRFEATQPGTYTVSAFYTVAGHGQIELRRSDIAVSPGEAVVVPLWVELTR